MAGIARSIRFLLGLAMVAGGGTLAAPVAVRLAAVVTAMVGEARGVPPAGPANAAAPAAVQPAPPPLALAAPVAATVAPAPPSAGPPGIPPQADVAAAGAVPGTAGPPPALNPDYRPPTPPTPLPTLPAEFVMPGPQVAQAYRSTLEVPPPPLLDSQQPPPLAVAWSAHSVPPPAPAAVAPVDVPQTYRVKDGDDLTSIAARFYGHPSAAAAIWEANRTTIADPSLLPIDAELRLPASWSVASAVAGSRAIEPSAAAPVSWLQAAGRQPPAPPAGAQRPGSVRVGPGETLATLAQRLYGDAGQASRIWEANRDRLRSPELVVAGMELRLP